jgi:SAM-dependent methyltransferase
MFQEIAKGRYKSFSVYDYFIAKKAISKEKVNVILRFDVDCNIYLAYLAAQYLKEKNIAASFYFFTSTGQYNIWESEFVKKISQMGFEVGIHTDHLSRQVQYGIDGISTLKEDAAKFSSLIGKPPEGMVYHVGKDGIENWHLYKYIEPEDLGLKYHDGFTSRYHDTQFNYFYPNVNMLLSDYYFFSNGWRLRPFMVRSKLRKAKKGESVHIVIHPTFMFKWWKMWQNEYGREKPAQRMFLSLLGKVLCRIGPPGFLNLVLQLSVEFLKLIGKLFFRATEEERSAYVQKTSYKGEHDFIDKKGISFWEEKVKKFNLVADRRVLDLGCGVGQWLIPLSHHNKKVVGIDPCFKSVFLAKENLNKYKVYNSSLVKAQAETLPFKDNSFDSVFCYGVLMFTREFIAFEEIVRILKKDGRVLLAIDGPGYFLKNIIDGMKYSHSDSIKLGLIALGNTLFGKYLLKRTNNLASFFTYAEIRSLFHKYGLKIQLIGSEYISDDMPSKYMGFPYFFFAVGQRL